MVATVTRAAGYSVTVVMTRQLKSSEMGRWQAEGDGKWQAQKNVAGRLHGRLRVFRAHRK